MESAAAFQPEAELVLELLDEAPARRWRIEEILSRGVDEERLIELLARHRIFALLYWRLRAISHPALSSSFRLLLRKAFEMETIAHLKFSSELVKIMVLLREEGIPALTYKGPALARELHDHRSALRHSWDLDILVGREDLSRVKSLLLARGYRPELPLSEEEEQRYLERENEYNFDHEDKNIHVEVHWDLLDAATRRSCDSAFMWGRTTEIPLGGALLTVPAPEEHLVALCIHGGGKHHWERLKWIYDVAFFVPAYPDLRWSRVLEIADEVGRRALVLEGLYLAVVLLGASLPAEMLRIMESDPMISAFGALYQGKLFCEEGEFPGYAEWKLYLERSRHAPPRNTLCSRVRSYLRYLQAVFAPEWGDLRRVSLPDSISFLHYFYRFQLLAHRTRGDLLEKLR